MEIPHDVREAGKRLDKHHIRTRYPNGFDVGAPTDHYTERELDALVERPPAWHRAIVSGREV